MRTRSTLSLLVAAGMAALACNAILGLEELEPAPGGDGSAADGGGDQGGSSGSAAGGASGAAGGASGRLEPASGSAVGSDAVVVPVPIAPLPIAK